MYGGTTLKKTLMLTAVSLACATSGVQANDCQVQLSQPVVDYGKLNPSVLRAGAKASPKASLGKRLLQLNVLCTDIKDMAVTFRGIAAGPLSYRLSNQGEFDLTLKDARLDGQPVLLGLVATPQETAGEIGRSVQLKPGHYVIPMRDQKVLSGKAFSMKVEVDSRLSVDGLMLRDVADLEGQGQFELN